MTVYAKVLADGEMLTVKILQDRYGSAQTRPDKGVNSNVLIAERQIYCTLQV